MRTLKIDCPCCNAKLVIDAEKGFVLEHHAHKEATQSLEEFLKGEKDRAGDLAQKFAQSKQREEEKHDMLEKKFEWAKKNKDKLPEAPKPNLYWD